MSLFQESIIRKHLGYLDQEVVDQAYLRFKEVYSANKISNIKIAKEEQYQEGFIKDIFGAVLGYSVFPEQPFNIQTEKKNESDSKKADGAIFQGENVVGVIELKDNKTKNLDAVKDQAFGYKNNHKECSYVISSNFHKLRFYLDDATDYEEFDLYNLDKETFKRFYLYLRKEGLLDKNIPKLLRQETKFHEENITKSLYKDYSSFKNSFFQNVVKNNPQHDKLLLFKKSQKFLDKVLFVLFAEDKGLVTTNSIVQIVEKWQDLKNDAFDTPKPLYELVALFFNNLFVGKKDQKGAVLIPEFGGEIFAPDEVLDTLMVDDEVLQDNLLKLSKYDFNTDVDVNILGHIFEHSLSEIEEVEASLKGEVADKTKGKRKKDGVFYTPKYITKYIVENTVGKLCTEKKAELKLDSDIAIFEHQKTDGKLNAKGIALYETLNQYKDWLLTLKILDPACGSGAFLNQAVNFLVQEHQFVDDIIAELTNSPLRLFDTDIAILENNIYGVDINEESIEIAKLSLWLRTAKQGRKLSNLSNNIKCGNSLIDDPEVAGDKAFNWQNEFPEIFAKGGFDVIIGNPPYVSNWTLSDSNREMVLWLSEHYKKDLTGHWDLFVCFISISIKYLKDGGYNSFILPTSFLKEKYGKLIREKIIENLELVEIVDFGQEVIFENVARQTFIYNIHKSTPAGNFVRIKNGISDVGSLVPQVFYKKLKNASFKTNVIEADIAVYNKLYSNSSKLGEIVCLNVGVVAHSNTSSPKKFTKDDVIYNEFKDGFKKYITGPNLSRYSVFFDNQYLDYDSNVNFFHRPKFKLLFENEKIIVRRTSGNHNSIIAYYDDQNYYSNDSMMHLIRWNSNVLNYQKPENKWTINLDDEFELKYLLVILCSKLSTYFFSKFLSTDTLQGAYSSIYPEDLREIPIKNAPIHQQKIFCEMSNLMLKNNSELQLNSKKFQKSILRKFAITELPKKLQDWYLLSYPEFIKELGKKKIKLSLSEEAEWETYFSTEAKKALELKAQITQTDKEIDQMVYALYELTEDEIKIVEGS